MNKVLFTVLFSLAVYTASSQRIYFIYLQTESQQPFFVKLDEKIYSSSASGYLILSRLKDSTYSFRVGFTGNTGGEPTFTCTVNKKDHGYLLKNFGEKGWGLYDLQTSSVQMAVSDVKKDASAVNTPVNAFTDLLSKAADDSTLKQKNVLPEEKKAAPPVATTKEEPVNTLAEKNIKPGNTKAGSEVIPASVVIKQQEDRKETGISKPASKASGPANIALQTTPPAALEVTSKKAADTAGHTALKTEDQAIAAPAVTPESFVRSRVARKSESSTTEGIGLVYVDSYADGSQDTIRLMIQPDGNVPLVDVAAKDTVVQKTNPAAIKDSPSQSSAVSPVGKSTVKNGCKDIASDADFYKLRKKMAGGRSDADMLDEAKKTFKTKCFTTGQVKNLAAMFLGDGGKYNFFDAAYQHISDTENFGALQSELKDEYFVNRFKAMLR